MHRVQGTDSRGRGPVSSLRLAVKAALLLRRTAKAIAEAAGETCETANAPSGRAIRAVLRGYRPSTVSLIHKAIGVSRLNRHVYSHAVLRGLPESYFWALWALQFERGPEGVPLAAEHRCRGLVEGLLADPATAPLVEAVTRPLTATARALAAMCLVGQRVMSECVDEPACGEPRARRAVAKHRRMRHMPPARPVFWSADRFERTIRFADPQLAHLIAARPSDAQRIAEILIERRPTDAATIESVLDAPAALSAGAL